MDTSSTPPSALPVDPPSISLNLTGVPHRKVPLPYGLAATAANVPLLQLRAGSHVRVTVGNGGKRAAAVAAVGYGGAGADGYGGGNGARTHYPSWLEVRAVSSTGVGVNCYQFNQSAHRRMVAESSHLDNPSSRCFRPMACQLRRTQRST